MSESLTPRTILNRIHIKTSLGDRLGTVLAITLLPVPLVSILYSIHGAITGTPSGTYSMLTGYLLYGVVNLVTVGLLYAILSPEHRSAVFRFRWPSMTETLTAILAFIVGLGVFQVTEQISSLLGYQLQGLSYSLSNPVSFFAILVGAVILAPLTEEILYRGLVLETLTERGFGAASATVLMTALFALIHLPNFGVAGTIFISVWGLLPAAMRFRYNNLSGAVVMHSLNNLFAYVIVVAAGWG